MIPRAFPTLATRITIGTMKTSPPVIVVLINFIRTSFVEEMFV